MQETVVIHQAHGSKQVWHDRWNRREKEWASTRELKIEGGGNRTARPDNG